jgi:hypothetical protein
MYKGMYRDVELTRLGKSMGFDQDSANVTAFEYWHYKPELVPPWQRPFQKVWDWIKLIFKL